MGFWETFAVGVGGIVVGALMSGAVQLGVEALAGKKRRRVASRMIQGDIYVAEAVFEWLLEKKCWPSFDVDPALRTWAEHRATFAESVTIADWADVDAFYNNLTRTAAMSRPGAPITDGDIVVAEAQIRYAAGAGKVVTKYVAKSEKEQQEVVDRFAEDAGAHPEP
jgi:hypothetical protein